jgi:hypothetical protein
MEGDDNAELVREARRRYATVFMGLLADAIGALTARCTTAEEQLRLTNIDWANAAADADRWKAHAAAFAEARTQGERDRAMAHYRADVEQEKP